MLKFKKDAIAAFIEDAHIKKMYDMINELPYSVKNTLRSMKLEVYDYRTVDNAYKSFASIYEEISTDLLFSQYPIRLVFDTKTSPNMFPDYNALERKNEKYQHFAVVKVRNTCVVVEDIDMWFDSKVKTDLSNIDVSLLANPAALLAMKEGRDISIPLSGMTYSEIVDKKSDIYSKANELSTQIEQIEKEQHYALAELKQELEKIQAQMSERKAQLMMELQEKKNELEVKSKALEKDMAVLDVTIYDLQSYLGESYELIQVRSGKKAPNKEPFIVSQKLRYLNEDLPVLVGMYDSEVGKEDNLIEVFKYSDTAVDYFCQSDKSITFFRLSKNAYYTSGFHGSSKTIENTRGKEVDYYMERIVSEKGHDFAGFLLKDGDNLYMGIIDEGKRVAVDEDVFMDLNQPSKFKESMNDDAIARTKMSAASERMARKFIFSLLQGLIDIKKIVQFDYPVSIFKLSPEIIFSSAYGAIGTSLYGNFSTLKDRLNNMTRVGDMIYLIDESNDSYRAKQSFNNYKPSMYAKNGFFEIKEIANGDYNQMNYYISIKREKLYDIGDTNARFTLNSKDFINVSYMNSEWLEYFISNKNVDKSSLMGQEFHLMVRHLLFIRDFLKAREESEKALIIKHLPDLDDYENWRVLLSEWKLFQKNPVREINDFQANRFANALKNGLKPNKLLYSLEENEALVIKKKFVDPEDIFDREVQKIQKSTPEELEALLLSTELDSKVENEIKFDKFVKFVYITKDTIKEAIEFKKQNSRLDIFKRIEYSKVPASYFEKHISTVKRNKINICSEIFSEMEALENLYKFSFISKNENISKPLMLIKQHYEDLDTLSKLEHTQLLKALVNNSLLNDEFNISVRNFRFFSIQNLKSNTEQIAAEKASKPDAIFIEREHELGPGYYPLIEGFKIEKLNELYLQVLIKVLISKYNKGIVELNNFVYYRTNIS